MDREKRREQLATVVLIRTMRDNPTADLDAAAAEAVREADALIAALDAVKGGGA